MPNQDELITSFLYTLIRDYVVPGDIERIVQDIEKHKDKETRYSNKYLESYCRNLVERLKP